MVWRRLSRSVQLACLYHFLIILVGHVSFTNTKAAWKNSSRATNTQRRVCVIRKKGEMNWNTLPLGSMTKPRCRVSSNLIFVKVWCSPINRWQSWDSLGKGCLSTGIAGGDCHDPENTFSKWCYNIHIFKPEYENSQKILTSKKHYQSIIMLKLWIVFILVRCRDSFCRWAHLPVSGGGVRTNWTGGCEISEL